jgi:hypothetical protein
MTYFKKNKFQLSEGPFLKFLDTDPQIRKKPLKIKNNTFSKIVLDIFSQSKITSGIVNFKNHCSLLRKVNVSVTERIADC